MLIRKPAATAALAAAAAALATAAPALAKTHQVHAGQSIQAAIDAAKPGDTIQVHKGTYKEFLLIRKNGIKLEGHLARLVPAASVPMTPCDAFTDSGKAPGICVIGNATANTNGPPTVTSRVKNVRISGFVVKGFPNDGVFVLAAKGTRVENNGLLDNGGYGAFANTSSHTKIQNNNAHGNSDAGFYVGDSPNARATVKNNDSTGNKEGILLRDASFGTVKGNALHGNCAGIIVLADAPGPAGNWLIENNRVNHNNKACPANGPAEPATSGIGIALLGAHGTTVQNNVVNGNTNANPSLASGGILVMKGLSGTAPVNDLIEKNSAFSNKPFDLSWDQTGTVKFKKNSCAASSPSGLCTKHKKNGNGK